MRLALALWCLAGCSASPSTLAPDVDRYRAAQAAAEAGRTDEARALYRQITAVERRSLAAFRLALLDDTDLRAVVDAFPDEVGADRAVAHLALHDPAPVDWLEAAGTRHAAREVGDNAVWWAAQASIRRFGDFARARRLLRTLVTRWPRSPYGDDALWTLGALYRQLGDADRALTVYASLIAARDETSWFVGSYASVFLDDAALLRGHVLFDTRRFDDAAAAYRGLLDRRPDSPLRDDAWWGLACALHAGKESPVAALDSLLEAHPESRHAGAAKAWRAGDASVATAPDSGRTLAPVLDVRHIGAP